MLNSLINAELVWVDQTHKLHEVSDFLARQDILAVDTESNSLYAYQEQVCLLQFSTRKKDILIDPLALPDLSLLEPIFNSDRILKVFHAAEYDLICLFRDYGFRFNYLFDTMIAARILGYQQVGLGSLLERFFGIQMNKKFQRANWGKRPLKRDMLEYARLDSRYLIPLQERLREELESSGWWKLALEDFRRLTQNIEDTTESNEEDFWNLRNARDLSPEKAAILKSVFQFREAVAKDQNRPPFKVISHQGLIEIAQSPPKHLGELAKLPSISEQIIQRYGKGLMQAIHKGKNAPPEYPPYYQRPQNAVLDRIEVLREWRKFAGRKLGVPSDVILPRDVVNRIGWEGPKCLDTLEKQMQDVPYRFERFGGEIMQTLQNGNKSA